MQELLTISEISVSYKPKRAHKPVITTSTDAVAIARKFISEDTIALQETFLTIYLNRANRVIGVFPVSIGGITGTVADPRLILAVALKTGACSIILAHNHPSGSLKPSRADEELTNKISQAAKYMDIRVVDHLIVSSDEETYYSFADEGLI